MIKGKTILLTGATGGIGSEISRLLSEQGANLLLVDIQESALENLLSELNQGKSHVEVMAADLAIAKDRERVKIFVESKYQSLDVLINCAGINVFSMFEDLDDDRIEKMITVNITSPILLTKTLLPLLKKSSAPQIINFGSTFGSIGYPGFSIYSATKFAIRGFTEALRRELANTNIKICYIAPRATCTSLNTGPVIEMNKALGVKMDPPELVAKQVLIMLEEGRSSIRYLGWPEKLFVRINSLIPRLVDNALVKQLDTIIRFANTH